MGSDATFNIPGLFLYLFIPALNSKANHKGVVDIRWKQNWSSWRIKMGKVNLRQEALSRTSVT